MADTGVAAAAALGGHQNAAALFAAVYVTATAPTPTVSFAAVFIAIGHAHVHHFELAGGQRGDDLFGGIAGAAAAEDADGFATTAAATTSGDLYSVLRFT